jgi:hypothetical protein
VLLSQNSYGYVANSSAFPLPAKEGCTSKGLTLHTSDWQSAVPVMLITRVNQSSILSASNWKLRADLFATVLEATLILDDEARNAVSSHLKRPCTSIEGKPSATQYANGFFRVTGLNRRQ